MSERLSAMIFKVILPVLAISFMVLFCYPVCNKPEGFDFFLFWILVGFPFGIRRMWLWLIPRNYGIAGSLGVIALDCIVGGIIGGFMAIVAAIKAVATTVQVITGREVSAPGEWRSLTRAPGAPSVMTAGTWTMPAWCAGSWAVEKPSMPRGLLTSGQDQGPSGWTT